VLLIIFILGWPFEWPAIILVFVPIFVPLVLDLDLGLTRSEVLFWFGILVAVNLQTAFLTPPVAASAFYLKNVMPSWSLGMIYKGMIQFIAIQVACIILLLVWPVLALWLPRVLY
jgi:TRAP-type mannitol/chloroaromatic compound transport system permease large subunit